MSSYSFCLFENHGVLPSAPLGPRTALVQPDWAVLRWNEPKRLPDTVLGYTVRVRELGDSELNDTYTAIAGQHSPFLLDRLTGGRTYEFFVTAVNDHGEGERSNRVIFETPPAEPDLLEDGSGAPTSVDPAVCCRESGVPPHCQKFCSYSGMAEEKEFGNGCENYWTQIAGCTTEGRGRAAGRCCTVALPDPCRSLCEGRALGDGCRRAALYLLRCATWQGVTRPPAVRGTHVTNVTGDSVTLVWQRQNDADQYQVFYGKLNSTEAVFHWQNRLDQVMDVTGTTQAQVAVARDALYGFSVSYVDANGTRAHWGSTLLVNGSAGSGLPKLSPPHGVTIRGVSAHGLDVTWEPPADKSGGASVRYRLYYQAEGEPTPRVVHLTDASHNLTGLNHGTVYSVWVTAVSDDGAESAPSETVEERTRSPQEIAPTLQLPRVDPRVPTEGGNMTITCVATGSPTPTVTLVLNNRVRNESRTHELVTTITNVTRNIELAQCSLEVEQSHLFSSRHILKRHAPRVWLWAAEGGEEESVPGRNVSLSCDVDAHPKPNMTWRGNHSEILRAGGNLNFTSIKQRPGYYRMEMTITNVTEQQFMTYTCHAENELGADSKQIVLKKRPNMWQFYKLGVSQCCRSMNISEPCQVACAEQEVDLEPVNSNPACLKEFSKLMVCAADGSDHRDCCSVRGIPDHCLSWCKGLDNFDHRLLLDPDCITIYAADIVGCFHEGKDLLPGRPRNVVATKLNATAALVRWEEPVRTGDHAVSYRVRWWPRGASSSAHLDTRRTSHLLTGLETGEQYQVAIRAANRRGVSLETTAEVREEGTDPERSVEQGPAPGTSSVLVPALTLTVLVMVLVAALVWVVRRRRLRRGPGAHVSFTNPAYVREGAIQESTEATLTDKSGGDGSAPGGGQHSTDSDDGWHETALETPVLGRDEHL
ncbi:Ig-like and fibronectin type-III domain-containing protein 1 isoform X2 [Amphibalanus amphitrite]|nr:Ig-like and fibronectin type-III domain-containing protein 1 isoform X2 [Amphibalanus amphitrite]XP_043211936.1 Ig-like and fibronectin type-III domain-containing protein 1 isoform X2 [Amphibalanus amphitrite]